MKKRKLIFNKHHIAYDSCEHKEWIEIIRKEEHHFLHRIYWLNPVTKSFLDALKIFIIQRKDKALNKIEVENLYKNQGKKDV